MFKYCFQFFILIIVINSYGQNDSVTISKKLDKARYWLTTKSFNDLKKLSNLVVEHQIPLDSFKVIYNEAFDDLSETLDSLDERERKQKTVFTISNLFESTVNYKGRIIDGNQPGNVLSLLVETPIGVNLYAAQNYWAYEKNPMALTELGIGFEKEFLDYFTASLDYERWIFANGPKKERNALSNFAAVSLNFESDHIYANAMYSYVWGTTKASAINLDLAYIKRFNFIKKLRAIELRPTTTFIAGNPNYSLSYFKLTKKKQSTQQTAITNENNFVTLDYEVSLAAIVEWKKFKGIAEQHFSFPVNGSKQDPVFNFNYFTFQIDYTFGVK